MLDYRGGVFINELRVSTSRTWRAYIAANDITVSPLCNRYRDGAAGSRIAPLPAITFAYVPLIDAGPFIAAALLAATELHMYIYIYKCIIAPILGQ